ncbi:MAG: glycosyltransferase family 2 protein [Candidatus Gastranaerophilales bacterium]|nr:glycosyltransferase family 2 protein [Candidatus Gastranaerophilales bacterium]
MIKDLITIITPCYNGEKHLKPYIDGLLSQTYQNVQYIFVNDGSNDKTEEIILNHKQEFEQKGWEFNYIFQENKGQAAAINKGLEIAKGEFLSCLDSDDIFLPTYLEKMAQYLKNNPECGICFPTSEFVKNDKTFSHLYFKKRIVPKGAVDNFVEDMFLTHDNTPAFSTFMLRMESFLKYTPSGKIFEAKSGQNPQLIMPIAYNEKVGYIEEVLAKIVVRNESDSNSNLIDKSHNWEYLYYKMLDTIPNMSLQEKEYFHNKIKERWNTFREQMHSSRKASHKVINFFGIKFKFKKTPD